MSSPFIGQLMTVGFNFAPRGWAFCSGQILAISSNTALFSLLGTTYGGDGRTTFALPDLRSRTSVHPGTGPGLDTISQGQIGGAFERTLASTQMPSHSHSATGTLNGSSADASTDEPGAGLLPAKTSGDSYASGSPVAMGATTVNVGNTGGSQAFNIRNPFLGMYTCIATVGIFPSRN